MKLIDLIRIPIFFALALFSFKDGQTEIRPIVTSTWLDIGLSFTKLGDIPMHKISQGHSSSNKADGTFLDYSISVQVKRFKLSPRIMVDGNGSSSDSLFNGLQKDYFNLGAAIEYQPIKSRHLIVSSGISLNLLGLKFKSTQENISPDKYEYSSRKLLLTGQTLFFIRDKTRLTELLKPLDKLMIEVKYSRGLEISYFEEFKSSFNVFIASVDGNDAQIYLKIGYQKINLNNICIGNYYLVGITAILL